MPSPAIPALDPGMFRSRVTWFRNIPQATPTSAGQKIDTWVNQGNIAHAAYLQPLGGRDIANARQLHPTTVGRIILRYSAFLAALTPGDKLEIVATGRELFVTWRYRELEQGAGGYLMLDYAEPIKTPPA